MTTIVADERQATSREDSHRTDNPRPISARLVPILGIAALAVPFVAMVIVSLTRPWLPSADVALMELRTADVGGPHTPLVGAYSRLGWHHPGPLSFWFLALPYRLAGARPVGMLLGTAALHAGAVIGCIAVARRRGGWALAAAVGLGLSLVIRAFGSGYLVLPWNPDLPVLAMALLLLATWSVLDGDRWLLPLAVAVACYSWQSHVGFLPVTATLTLVALTAALTHRFRARRAGDQQPGAGTVADDRGKLLAAATAVTAALCLAPIAVEEVIHEPGNLSLIVESMLHPRDPAIGLEQGARIAAQHLSPIGTWLTGHDPINPFSAAAVGTTPWLLLAPAAAVVAALVIGRRAGLRAPTRLVAVSGIAAAAGIVTVSRTTGAPYYYLFAWLRPIAMVLWGSVIWTLAAALVARGGPAERFTGPGWRRGALVATALATLVASVASITGDRGLMLPDEVTSAKLQVLVPAAVSAAAGHPRVELVMAGGWCAGEIGHGMGLQLVEHGIEVAVNDHLTREYTPRRVLRGEELPTVEVICGPGTLDYANRSPIPPSAIYGPLAPEELAELTDLQERFRAQIRAGGRPDLLQAVENHAFVKVVANGMTGIAFDPAQIERFGQLMAKGERSAAVFFHPKGKINIFEPG